MSSAFAHGTITLLMRTPRTLDVLKLAAEVTMIGEAQSNLAVSVQASAEHGPGGETYSLSLSRGGRRAVVFDATSSQATGGVSGTWKANLVESDLAPFSPFTTLPTLAAVGEGSFEADSGLSRMHAVGRLKSAAGSLSFLAPILERVGKANVDVDFDATLSGRSLHVGHLMLSLEGARSTVVVQSLQTFDFDGNTGSVVVPKPGEDFFEGSVKGLPLEWLSSPTSRLRFTAGEANARFVIRPHDGGFSLRLKEPLTASGVSVAGLAGLLSTCRRHSSHPTPQRAGTSRSGRFRSAQPAVSWARSRPRPHALPAPTRQSRSRVHGARLSKRSHLKPALPGPVGRSANPRPGISRQSSATLRELTAR